MCALNVSFNKGDCSANFYGYFRKLKGKCDGTGSSVLFNVRCYPSVGIHTLTFLQHWPLVDAGFLQLEWFYLTDLVVAMYCITF